jgi:hypothetical protein
MNANRFKAAAGALLASAALACVATPAAAQTKTTVQFKEVHYEFDGGAPLAIGDPKEGRQYGVWVRRGVTMLDNGEVAAYSALGDYDLTKGSGVITGFDTTTFPDGSSWTTRFKGQFSVGPKGLWVIPHEGQFVKGTGRFEGISGTLVYTSRQVDKRPEFAKFAETEGSATYTLPVKAARSD